MKVRKIALISGLFCNGLVSTATANELKSIHSTKDALVRSFVENLGKVEHVKSLFPTKDMAHGILQCETDNLLWLDIESQLKILDENHDVFKDIQSEFLSEETTTQKKFLSGDKKGACSFQQNVSIFNIKVNVRFAKGEKTTLDTDFIQVLFVSNEFYLLSL